MTDTTLEAGDTVRHPTFGRGTVERVAGRTALVAFETAADGRQRVVATETLDCVDPDAAAARAEAEAEARAEERLERHVDRHGWF